jgi:hypothetical protein
VKFMHQVGIHMAQATRGYKTQRDVYSLLRRSRNPNIRRLIKSPRRYQYVRECWMSFIAQKAVMRRRRSTRYPRRRFRR